MHHRTRCRPGPPTGPHRAACRAARRKDRARRFPAPRRRHAKRVPVRGRTRRPRGTSARTGPGACARRRRTPRPARAIARTGSLPPRALPASRAAVSPSNASVATASSRPCASPKWWAGAAGDTPDRRATSRSEKPATPRSASRASVASIRLAEARRGGRCRARRAADQGASSWGAWTNDRVYLDDVKIDGSSCYVNGVQISEIHHAPVPRRAFGAANTLAAVGLGCCWPLRRPRAAGRPALRRLRAWRLPLRLRGRLGRSCWH